MKTIDRSLRLKKEIALKNYQSSQTALDYETPERAKNRCNNHLLFLYKNEIKALFQNLDIPKKQWNFIISIRNTVK